MWTQSSDLCNRFFYLQSQLPDPSSGFLYSSLYWSFHSHGFENIFVLIKIQARSEHASPPRSSSVWLIGLQFLSVRANQDAWASFIKTQITGAWVVAQSVRCMPCKREDPSLIFCNYVKDARYGGLHLQSHWWGGGGDWRVPEVQWQPLSLLWEALGY